MATRLYVRLEVRRGEALLWSEAVRLRLSDDPGRRVRDTIEVCLCV